MRSPLFMCSHKSHGAAGGRRVSCLESVGAEPPAGREGAADRDEHQRGAAAAAQRTHAGLQQTQNAQRPHLAPQELLPPARATTHQACQVSHKIEPSLQRSTRKKIQILDEK
jgi:hypothetical protein